MSEDVRERAREVLRHYIDRGGSHMHPDEPRITKAIEALAAAGLLVTPPEPALADLLKVAVCEYLIAVNADGPVDPKRPWLGPDPFIPPTAIDWLGNGLVDAVLGIIDRPGCDEIDRLRAAAAQTDEVLAAARRYAHACGLFTGGHEMESYVAICDLIHQSHGRADRIDALEAELEALRAAAVTPEQRRLIAIGEAVSAVIDEIDWPLDGAEGDISADLRLGIEVRQAVAVLMGGL